jgi:hypothetical protein
MPLLEAAAALVDVGQDVGHPFAALASGELTQFLLQLRKLGGWLARRVLLGTRHERTSFGLRQLYARSGEEGGKWYAEGGLVARNRPLFTSHPSPAETLQIAYKPLAIDLVELERLPAGGGGELAQFLL